MKRLQNTVLLSDKGHQNTIGLFLKWLGPKINSFFQPEEVEVTFKEDGAFTKYTYTKVNHKQVA